MLNLSELIKPRIKAGGVYAIQTGDYCGEMWIFIEEKNDNYYFLSSPKMENREVPIEKFDFGKENEIIEYVDEVPRSFYKVVKKQYQENGNKLRPSQRLRSS